MDKFEKNFHINFSPLYITVVIMFAMCFALDTKADEIEEIVVVAQQETELKEG